MKKTSYLVLFAGVILLGTAIYLNLLNLKANKCANSITCANNLEEEYKPGATGTFEGQEVIPPAIAAVNTPIPGSEQVLGEVSNKRIEVDLTNQRLYAYEGGTRVMDFPVSTGKWWPTPTGEFKTWIKLRSTRMSGGNWAAGTYYNLPNVPHTMYFYNDEHPQWQGYGLHGAYWHNNFGQPMSHGCVNIGLEDAERLFYWAPLGVTVSIYGETPAV